MSSVDPTGQSVPKEKEKKGVGKLLSRVKTVLRRGERGESSSRRFSLLGSSKSKKTETQPAEEAKATPPEQDLAIDQEGVIKVKRAQLFEERAKVLSERFGLHLEPSEWHKTEGTALRIEKPIRMRVRRTCHKCSATFGVAKECPSCNHIRCTKCVRHPPKRSEEESKASKERWAAKLKAAQENPPLRADWRYDDSEYVLKRPPRPCQQDLVYKKPRQRVRRTCHECSTLFLTGSKKCEKCGHVRCTDCPRDPPKKDKYPFGYPGDEFGPNSIPYHECHECKSIYAGGATDGTECEKCKPPKCEQCPRLKPRKVDPAPDPDVLKSVQEKLANVKIE